MVVLLLRYIFGFLRIRIDGEYPERFINLCKINGINLWNIIRIDDSIYANIEAKKFLHLRKFRRKSRVKIKIIKKTGAYFLIRPYLKRKGIAVGVIIFFLLNVFLSQFIWNIEINGNKTIDNNTIIDNCRSIGIYEGILSKNIDTNDARLKLIMENNDISWASFIIEGSHLTVNILETEKTEKSDKTPGNLIASNDGIIEYIEISKGKPLVKRDQVVVKGQILSTGAIEYSDGTTHFVKSTGKVYAKTEKTLDVNIDYVQKMQIKTGEKTEKKLLSFFGVNIPLNYDVVSYPFVKTIDKEVVLVDNAYLPIFLYDIKYKEIKNKKIILSKNEAINLAKNKIEDIEKEQFDDMEIVNYEESIEYLKDGIILKRKYECRENIAKFQKIKINTTN